MFRPPLRSGGFQPPTRLSAAGSRRYDVSRSSLVTLLAATFAAGSFAAAAEPPAGPSRAEATDALRRAGAFFHDRVAVRGGYVYQVSEDLSRRWGEGEAAPTQIWVQPPATPTVGEAFLAAYAATGEPAHLAAATDAAEALLYGQLRSGGWTNKVDFDPAGDPAAYRGGRGRGKDNSSLDDGQTPAALRFLMRADIAHAGRHAAIREAATFGLNALLNAQMPGGGFPLVFTGRSPDGSAGTAQLPAGDWRDLPKINKYWTLPTLNDGLARQVADTLVLARTWAAGHDRQLAARCDAALRRLGDFLIRARLPQPQPGWAQQYDDAMRPAWARKFEPPAVATSESQDAIAALLTIHAATGEDRFLAPLPAALDYLDRSALPGGRLPRFLELGTNRPLYMRRAGREYEPTYDLAEAPDHYGWALGSRTGSLRARLRRAERGAPEPEPTAATLAARAREAIEALDESGRWVDVADGSRLVGQPRFPPGTRYLASATFVRNLTALAAYLQSLDER